MICMKFDDEVKKKNLNSEVKWLRYRQKRKNRKFTPNAFSFYSMCLKFYSKEPDECYFDVQQYCYNLVSITIENRKYLK